MKKIYLIIIGALALLACSEEQDGLGARVSEDELQLSQIEEAIAACNTNISAIQALVTGRTVLSAKESAGTWTVNLSDGSVLTLKQGTAGVGNPPAMSVDADGWWMVDYGSGAQYLLDGAGKKVFAAGMSAVTPAFSVDADGYWTVSLDGGVSYSRVLDSGSAPVKATPASGSAASYFKDVSVSGSVLTLILRSGESLSVPIRGNFSCIIDATGVQAFTAGQVRSFSLTLEGVASTFTVCPDGWAAAVEGSSLKVTAPSAGGATSGVVSVVAVDADGLSTVAGLQVSM